MFACSTYLFRAGCALVLFGGLLSRVCYFWFALRLVLGLLPVFVGCGFLAFAFFVFFWLPGLFFLFLGVWFFGSCFLFDCFLIASLVFVVFFLCGFGFFLCCFWCF